MARKMIEYTLRVTHGEVSEWFKELVLKTSDPARDRGFESHLLRYNKPSNRSAYVF